MESDDQRKRPRVKAALSCAFGTVPTTPRSGKVTSLSASGCFVKTKAYATRGSTMYISLWLPERRWLALKGTVLYHMDGVGFGVSFESLFEDDEAALNRLISGEGPAPQSEDPE